MSAAPAFVSNAKLLAIVRDSLARLHLACDALEVQTCDVDLEPLDPEARDRLYRLAEQDLWALVEPRRIVPGDVMRDPVRARRLRAALATPAAAPRPEGPQ